MRSLRRINTKTDPAPSRWAWRIERWMLTPGVRFGLRAGLPFAVCFGLACWWFSVEANRMIITDAVADLRAGIESRPEFQVNLMAIDGVDDGLSAQIRDVLSLDLPQSSFDLELEQIRQSILSLDPVKEATVRIRPGGIMQVDVTPREPVIVWRRPGGLTLLDENGARVSDLQSRGERRDLPIIAGSGANLAIPEALALFDAAAPLDDRMRGLVRMGERRWDVVLDREQRIQLPETEAVQALERVIALDAAQNMLERDIRIVDMRLGQRPTLRMTEHATAERWRVKHFEQRTELPE